MMRIPRKQTLRSLSLSYQNNTKRRMGARGRPSFFWYDTNFLEFDSADIIDYILEKSVSYQKFSRDAPHNNIYRDVPCLVISSFLTSCGKLNSQQTFTQQKRSFPWHVDPIDLIVMQDYETWDQFMRPNDMGLFPLIEYILYLLETFLGNDALISIWMQGPI